MASSNLSKFIILLALIATSSYQEANYTLNPQFANVSFEIQDYILEEVHFWVFHDLATGSIHVTIENTDEPKRMLLDRYFNLCPILKSKKMFPAMKAFARDRVNVPLRCPLKKGEAVIKLRWDFIDPLNIMQMLGEFKRLSPALTVNALKKTFAVRIEGFT